MHQKCVNSFCDINVTKVHKSLLHSCHVYHETGGNNFFHTAGNFPGFCEIFQTFWKVSKLFWNFPDSFETFQNVQKLSRLSKNFPDCLETIVLHLPPGHLPPPFLWHLPPLFLWHLPPPTFVHLPPGQLPPLNFFLIFHLFKRFKMTNFSLEVVMDEVLDM